MAEAGSQPFVSVVVALYNEEDNLHMCTDALLRLRYPADRYEVLLVDDGSEDASARICREIVERHGEALPTIRYVPIEHAGLSVARNSGIAAARGDLIAFIDADAAASEGWLDAMVEAFEDERVGAVGGRIDPLNAESRMAHFLAAIHYDRSPVIGANMAYRPQVFEEVGAFCPVFTYRGDEANLVRRIRHAGDWKIEHADAAIVQHWLPPRLKRWLRERWTTGKLWYTHRQVDLAWGGAVSDGGLLRMLVDLLANVAFLPLLVLASTTNAPLAWFALIIASPVVVVRYVFPGKLRRHIHDSLTKRFGTARAARYLLPGLLTIYLGSLADDLAFFAYMAVDQKVDPGEIPRPVRRTAAP